MLPSYGLRTFITRRKISGGTLSRDGPHCSRCHAGPHEDLPARVCHYLGDPLLGPETGGSKVPPLADLSHAPSDGHPFRENGTRLPPCAAPALFSFRKSCGETFPLPAVVAVHRHRFAVSRMTIPACVWAVIVFEHHAPADRQFKQSMRRLLLM